MRDYETGLTQEELKRILHYNPDTGIFTWKVNLGRVKKGRLAGCKRYRYEKGVRGSPNYLRIYINGFGYQAHRLAWLYMTGEWPNIIDHDDGNPFNNKWDNLNNGTSQENSKNLSINKRNKSGVTGVSWKKRDCKWESSIKVNI